MVGIANNHMLSITEIQGKLQRAGLYTGGIDGDWGPKTQRAWDVYQDKGGVLVPAWMLVAERELGVREIRGGKDNPRILEYHDHTTLKATDDETPWCSSFQNFCFDSVGINGTHSAAASSWLDWGQELTRLRYGAILVFKRSGGNHVAQAVAWDSENVLILGGNQGDEVSVAMHTLSNLRGIRWPTAGQLAQMAAHSGVNARR